VSGADEGTAAGFDLDQYLARIGLKAPPEPTAEGLALLQRAHRLSIPFENLDVILGRGIAIDSASVFAKLVTARRGGYCFEHNRLFGDALDALGFVHRPLLARVWLGIQGPPPPRTHTLSLVTIDGRDWIADAGFGGSYAPPMPLADGESASAPDGAQFRLMRDPLHGWMLERDGDLATTDGRHARRPRLSPPQRRQGSGGRDRRSARLSHAAQPAVRPRSHRRRSRRARSILGLPAPAAISAVHPLNSGGR
jgi:arylamine N-acetyltransferase